MSLGPPFDDSGERLRLGTREFDIFYTPGHALHHHSLYDRKARAVFTGDVFGVSYRTFDSARGPWSLITTTPTRITPIAPRSCSENRSPPSHAPSSTAIGGLT